jgi:hypothetical protein
MRIRNGIPYREVQGGQAGSKALVNCTCNKGFTGPDGVECTACDAGGFQGTNGSAACTLCSQGKYSTATASISCRPVIDKRAGVSV